MIRHAFVRFIPLLVLTSPALGAAQTAGAPPNEQAAAKALDAAARRDIVAKLSEELRERYVFPDVGERAAVRITKAMEAGEYDGLPDQVAFTQRLSSDVHAIARDKHLNIMSPGGRPPPGFAPSTRPIDEAGITRADKLPGGIGYIEVVGFPPHEAFKPVLDRAMSALEGSRSLIIDVRRNGGGSPESVAYFVSYLMNPGLPLTTIVSRTPKTKEFTRKTYSSVATPVSFAKVPVIVLTSKDTFSGGEDFAYTAQSFKRGTIVGEVTGGGANPTGPVDLGHGVMASIPFGRSENPVTKTNWEGRGVQPDIAVAASQGLGVALQRGGLKSAKEVQAVSVERVFTPRTTALPGHEAAIRRLVVGLASGQPDYSRMAPRFADLIRRDLSRLHSEVSPLGELRSIKFRQPMMGGDEFVLRFANGSRLMPVVLGQDGKIIAALPPIPAPPEE